MFSKLNLLNQILYLNIGPYKQEDSYFHWQSKKYEKSSFFDLKLTRNAPESGIFYCHTRVDSKLVYYVAKDTVFSINMELEVQSQLMEAILEYIANKFFENYDESLLMTCSGDMSQIFNGFEPVVEEVFRNYDKLDLIKTALVTCNGCKKNISIVVKKSLIEQSTKPTAPLVYVHSGHALLIYLDKQFKVRGAELVSISY